MLAAIHSDCSRCDKKTRVAEAPVGKDLRHNQQAAVDQPKEEARVTVLGHAEGEGCAIVERSSDVRKLALKQEYKRKH